MWWTINIIVLVAGVALILLGKHIDSRGSEEWEAILPFMAGAVFLIVGAISSGIKAFWF